MTDTRSTDVLVIGAGPGGYVAGIRGGQLDLDVTVVEADARGGACLNRGCIPSKALISAASLAYDAQTSEEMGISAEVDVDFEQLTRWKDRIVRRMGKGVEQLCKANGVELVEGRAVFQDSNRAHVYGEDGDIHDRIEFEHAIVATGSKPIELPGFGFDQPGVLNAEQALSLPELPDRLVVVGAGYIGMELSMVFAKLGVDVTVVEALDAMLPSYPSELVDPVRSAADDLGIDINYGELASECRESGQAVIVETEAADTEDVFEYESDAALVAVGREPVTDTVNLDAIGLEPDDNGFLATNDHCRTAVPHVFAVGDVAGEPMLAHKASAEGEVAAGVIAGRDESINGRAIPAVVFTSPEIATVGLSASEAKEAGYDVTVGEFPFRASGRALTTGHREGFARLVMTTEGRIVGGHVVGPEASELIAEIGLAVEQGLSAEVLADTVHAHPTLAESIHEAAGNALGRAIHTTN